MNSIWKESVIDALSFFTLWRVILYLEKRIIILKKVFPKKKKYFIKEFGCLYCEDILTKI